MADWFYSTRPLQADLILTNAVIFTSDDSLPFADSMAVHNGMVLRLGNLSALQVLHFVPFNLITLDFRLGIFVFLFNVTSHFHRTWLVLERNCWILMEKLYFLDLLILTYILFLEDSRLGFQFPRFQLSLIVIRRCWNRIVWLVDLVFELLISRLKLISRWWFYVFEPFMLCYFSTKFYIYIYIDTRCC